MEGLLPAYAESSSFALSTAVAAKPIDMKMPRMNMFTLYTFQNAFQ